MQATLYDRLGGIEPIRAVVGDFVDRVRADGRINQKFAQSDIGRLRAMLVDQVCEAAGGPCRYGGRSMKDAHRGMEITAGEFDALLDDLATAFKSFKVGKEEQRELLDLLGSLKTDVVEVNSKTTGTALPSTYQPAPALTKK